MRFRGDFSLHCPPGTRVLLELAGLEEKLATACVGHQRGRFVVVQMPSTTETARDALYQLLYPDNTVIARYLHEGSVVGFSARLIRCIQIPFPLIFLTYPAHLESHDLRKHKRITCCLPGRIRLGDGYVEGLLMDVSISGCQFSIPRKASAPEPAIDAVVELSCELIGSAAQTTFTCAVKRVLTSARRVDLGLKFKEMPQAIRESLVDYLNTARHVLG
ncbi:type IV pilus assembly PilZ [Solidesulfovibrio fructosivorans JJ]]|uniref:Type IV pilus assembly PilZ n=1 Tax=Solidesulfovibrio fructosivorans JJ] TaxID=596151 RepID=E1JXA0_SOLFR|nr:flagellar brake protein [Solidesulfovibrio fructosivorans]EFL51065.1 type IV pilus assembly PilZ [Solidesulfovibrio fructosivorans JJ]]